MTEQRLSLINIAVSKPDYKSLCRKVSHEYADDIFQEICLQILEMPEKKLPDQSYFNFWFYRVANNMISRYGQLGKLFLKQEQNIEHYTEDEQNHEDAIREAEQFMLSLTEFENRVIHLYNKYGNMKEVQRITGISYSALRHVKNKMKSTR